MRIRSEVIVSLSAIALLIGCGSNEPPAQPVAAPKLEGMLLAGSPIDAKQSGSTECKDDYYNFSCTKQNAREVMGVPVKRLAVTLEWELGDTERDPKKSHYDAVSAEFQTPEIDYACQRQGGYYSCAKDQNLPVVQLERKLLADGWIVRKFRRDGAGYYKAGVPFILTAYSDINSAYRPNTEVKFQPASPEEIKDAIAQVRAEESSAQKAANRSDSFISDMKDQ